MIQLSQLAFLCNKIKGQNCLAVNLSLIIKKKLFGLFQGLEVQVS